MTTATLLGPENADEDWPVIGPETRSLLGPLKEVLPESAIDGLLKEACQVLRAGWLPTGDCAPQNVGLVTGYVQSGKTLNFTTVCALARDNAVPLIIVITGISTNLFAQSNDRLERDLRLRTRDDRKWLHIPIDTRSQSPAQRIGDTLQDWRDSTIPDPRKQTVLITVMKNHRNLSFLIGALESISEIGSFAALIIDDEGDQASLNYLVAQGRESTNYRRIGQLRSIFPRHTFLQYTATPQAPLLVNLIDALSPSFASVLTPGPGYTGGLQFFPLGQSGAARIVRNIPASEQFSADQQLTAPPPTYRAALATFFVGVAAGEICNQGRGNRTMLVHPHQTQELHEEYFVWAEALKTDWLAALSRADNDESFRLVSDQMKAAYSDLRSTVDDLPDWDAIAQELPRAIRKTTVWEVNCRRGQTPSIPWRDRYAHILVGGQAMDRGFTVEGLTVTYMPRGLGDGNADTIQQRARFFGYKQAYFGYCRVWLELAVRNAFETYVEHEDHMRRSLQRHATTGLALRDWKRAFFLDQALRPTRRQVVSVAYLRGNHSQRWVVPTCPHDLQEAIDANNALIDSFCGKLAFTPTLGDSRRTKSQQHLVADGVPLKDAFEQLIAEVRLTHPRDSLDHTALLLQVGKWLEDHPNATCSVFLMAPEERRFRTLGLNDEIQTIFQGANPSTGSAQGSVYPGDQKIRHSSDLTIQVHSVELRPARKRPEGRIYPQVKLLAIYVPDEIGKDWLIQ